MKLPEPVGAVYTINGLRHCTLTQEPSETDLFTAAQMIEYRNQALDEAARVCEQFTHYGEASGIICVKQIRALKEVQS